MSEPAVPPMIAHMMAAAMDMNDIELCLVLGPVLTVLVQRRGAADVRVMVEKGIAIAEAQMTLALRTQTA